MIQMPWIHYDNGYCVIYEQGTAISTISRHADVNSSSDSHGNGKPIKDKQCLKSDFCSAAKQALSVSVSDSVRTFMLGTWVSIGLVVSG